MNYDNIDPVKKLKLNIKQEWERFPSTKLQQLVSLVPKRLIVVKRKGDETFPYTSSLDHVVGINSK